MLLMGQSFAQKQISQQYAAKGMNKLQLKFDFPKTVKLQTWDKEEVLVRASVSINGGENDEAFLLNSDTKDGVLFISNTIKDREKLPKTYVINSKQGKLFFKTKQALREHMGNKEGGWDYWGEQTDIDITVEVFVPAALATQAESVYGLVEVRNFDAPLQVKATYGGIDAALSEKQANSLSATTKFGQIYTNLSLQYAEKKEQDFYSYISTVKNGTPAYSFTANYGNLYLRKR